MSEEVVIEVDREGCCAPGTGYQLGISAVDENGHGIGVRLAGPKYCTVGKHESIARFAIDADMARDIYSYIRSLLGEDVPSTAEVDARLVAVGEWLDEADPTTWTDPNAREALLALDASIARALANGQHITGETEAVALFDEEDTDDDDE